MERPDYMIIGAMKSGTGSLHWDLCNHPQVVHSEKETHFFDSKENMKDVGGMPGYDRMVSSTGNNEVVGEATPLYLQSSNTPYLVNEHLDTDPLFIVLFRNPIDRALSHYNHTKRSGDGTLDGIDSFEEAIQKGPVPGIIGRGHYDEKMETWLSVYDRDQFYLMCSEDYWHDPVPAYRNICKRLEIDPQFRPNFTHAGNQSYSDMDDYTRKILEDHYKKHAKRLKEIVERMEYPPTHDHWFKKWS